jgi:hypothetical protein
VDDDVQPLWSIVEIKAFTLNFPANELLPSLLPAGKSLENCAFRYRETTDFDCHRVERTSSGLECIRRSPAFFTGHRYANYELFA